MAQGSRMKVRLLFLSHFTLRDPIRESVPEFVSSSMQPSTPAQTFFASGFPSALEDLRALPSPVESDLVLGLHALLTTAGMSVEYAESDVISGHAAQFLYSREHPECLELSLVPPVDTLFRALEVTWKEVTPSGPGAAYEALRMWLYQGRLALARLKEPLLVFGYRQSGLYQYLQCSRLRSQLDTVSISLPECDAAYWRYPLDEGNLLISVEAAPKRIENLTDLARIAARRALRAWHRSELAGCWCGDQAYRRFAADLADLDVDFAEERCAPWMGPALWRQWTSRASSATFFQRSAPRFGGIERNAASKAAFCYGQCVESWLRWARCLGPAPGTRGTPAFNGTFAPEYVARWRNPEARIKASHWIEEARRWEDKAVGELTRIVH